MIVSHTESINSQLVMITCLQLFANISIIKQIFHNFSQYKALFILSTKVKVSIFIDNFHFHSFILVIDHRNFGYNQSSD